MRQQEIDSLFASVEQAMTAPTEPKESIAKQIARVKPKGTVKLTAALFKKKAEVRSEEHTSELQSLMRISYAVFCLTKKNKTTVKEAHRTETQIQHKYSK